MFCTKCGNAVSSADIFCSKCAQKVESIPRKNEALGGLADATTQPGQDNMGLYALLGISVSSIILFFFSWYSLAGSWVIDASPFNFGSIADFTSHTERLRRDASLFNNGMTLAFVIYLIPLLNINTIYKLVVSRNLDYARKIRAYRSSQMDAVISVLIIAVFVVAILMANEALRGSESIIFNAPPFLVLAISVAKFFIAGKTKKALLVNFNSSDTIVRDGMTVLRILVIYGVALLAYGILGLGFGFWHPGWIVFVVSGIVHLWTAIYAN